MWYDKVMSVTVLDIILNMSLAGWVVAVASLLMALLSGIVFWQDSTKHSSKFFFFFGLVVGGWGMAYAFFGGALGTSAIHIAVATLYLVAGLVPLSIFLFLYDFSVKGNPFSFWKFIAVLIPYFGIVSALTVPGFIVSYKEASGDELGAIIFGKGYPIYILYVLAFLIAGFIVLVKKYRESAGVFKSAIRSILTALFSASAVAVSTMLFFPLFGGGHDLFWVGHMVTIIFGFATSFILIKYNFWSLKIVAVEFFVSMVALVLIIELFLATSTLGLSVKAGIALFIIFSSPFLVGSVKREIQSGDKITRLLKDLDYLHKQLKVLDKKKSEFLSIASHHLRDPLTAIRGYASMLTEGSFGELPAPLNEAVEKILESSKRLITMISDFMDISRIESGDMNFTFTDVDMKRLVLDLADDMKSNAEHVHLGFDVTIDEGPLKEEPFMTVGDAGKLRQVISNLIDNSIKYTTRGHISVLLHKSPDKKKIIFSIADTGIGMNASTLDKIFVKFSRAGDAGKAYTEGRGLGLYVAKELIKKHEGRIWAESKGEGMGSSFYVELEAKG